MGSLLDSQIAHRGHEPGRDALRRVQADQQVGPTKFMERTDGYQASMTLDALDNEWAIAARRAGGSFLIRRGRSRNPDFAEFVP